MSGESPDTRATSESGAPPRAESSGEDAVEAVLRTFLEDSSLWPVLTVAILILATLVCALLVLAFSDRNVSAMAATALALFLSYQLFAPELRARRLGPRTWIALGIWGLALVAWIALHWSSVV